MHSLKFDRNESCFSTKFFAGAARLSGTGDPQRQHPYLWAVDGSQEAVSKRALFVSFHV
jgi:hypothetical protein